MRYVDKNLALGYLANSEVIFNKIKDSFLNSYQSWYYDISNLESDKDCEGLYRYIHSIKGISLNIGSQLLYDDSCKALKDIKDHNKSNSLDAFKQTLSHVYDELKLL